MTTITLAVAATTAAPLLAGIPTQAQITDREGRAAGLLATLRDQAADLFDGEADGFTITAVGNFFGTWAHVEAYDYVRTGRIQYLDDDDLDPVDVAVLAANLAAFAEVAAPEHIRRARNGWTLVDLNP
jgi:hypothetical protein